MSRWKILATCALVTLAACGSPDADEPKGTSLDTKPGGSAPPIDHPPVDPGEAPVTSAEARRLSVAQLRRSMPVAMGRDAKGAEITWRDGSKPGFDLNAGALGEPDYRATTDESLEPSPLYAKLLDDAARSTCDQALTADRASLAGANGGDAKTRTLLRHAALTDLPGKGTAAIDANLRYLKLRLHAVRLPDAPSEAAEAELAPLRALFVAAAAGASKGAEPEPEHVAEAWRVVCIALVTAPEFHLY